MDKKLKTKWVKALRSGKYRQGSGQMRLDDEGDQPLHCCLGVLCEVAGEDYEDEQSMPSDDFLWLHDLPEKTCWKLIGMNDEIGRRAKSFAQIANWIEKHL